MARRGLLRRLALPTLLSLASLGGCALVLGGEFGDKTLRGTGGNGSGGNDSGGSGGRDAGMDAREDAPGDAMDDGQPDGPLPDAGPSPCDTTHTFCDDFDHEDATFAAWFGVDEPTTPATELLEMATDEAVSAPNSFHVRVTQQQESQLALNQLFGGSTKAMHCELDIRHDALPGDGHARVLQITLPGVSYLALTLGDANSLGACVEGGPCSIAEFAGPSPGVWAHFVIDMNVETGLVAIALGKVGTPPFNAGTANAPAAPGYAGGIQLALGIVSEHNLTGPFDAHFDDVWCDITP